MIDLHSHILPGVDDGARTMDDARELATRAAADGVTAIAATPHVRDDYPTSPDDMEAGVGAVRADLAGHGIDVDVLTGGEVDVERAGHLSRDDLARFTLAGTGRYLLVEFPYAGWPLGLDQSLFNLRAAGLTPVLAHPERNRDVQARPIRLEPLVAAGTLVQVTAASVDGRIGRSARETAERLLEHGLVHVLASDAHTPDVREAGLAEAARAVGDAGLARYLTEEAPAAIVAGERVEPAPARRRRGFFFRR